MRILLFGGEGQLGGEILRRAQQLSFEVISPVYSEVSITDREQVLFLAEKLSPQFVINCAAYTAVDDAESDADLAFAVNAEGVRNCVLAAKEISARFMHISTDYVFRGEGRTPLSESDPTDPISIYGKSKLEGERIALHEFGDSTTVVRTSSLHGARGQNFVNTMLRLFRERTKLQVVSDQIMSPTWAGWLAEVLLDLCRVPACGLVHASGAGEVSWYDFACEIQALVREDQLVPGLTLEPVLAADYARAASRPQYSVLSCKKLEAILGRPCLSWREGLRHHLRELKIEKSLS